MLYKVGAILVLISTITGGVLWKYTSLTKEITELMLRIEIIENNLIAAKTTIINRENHVLQLETSLSDLKQAVKKQNNSINKYRHDMSEARKDLIRLKNKSVTILKVPKKELESSDCKSGKKITKLISELKYEDI